MDLSAIIDEFNRRKAQAGQQISDLFNAGGRMQGQQPPKAMPAPRDISDSFVADLLRSARTAPDRRENIHKTLADIAERMTQVGPRSSPQTYEVLPQQPPAPAIPTGRSLTDMFTPPKKPADWFQQMQQGQNAVITPEQRSNVHKELADIAERMAAGIVPEPIRARERAMRTDPSAAAKPFTSEEVKGITPFVTAAAPIAYHGTPHTFDKFDASKIGTGQGAQSYGHGLYFAENPEVAQSYAPRTPYKFVTSDAIKAQSGYPVNTATGDKVSVITLGMAKRAVEDTGSIEAAIEKLKKTNKPLSSETAAWLEANQSKLSVEKTGNMYQVNIPDQHAAKMLDWDKPLSEQPEITKALQGAFDKANKVFMADQNNTVKAESVARLRMALEDTNLTGQQVYETLHSVSGHGSKNASEFLNNLGIPGIKYLDQGSRTAGQGTRNFVVFDPAILEDVTRK